MNMTSDGMKPVDLTSWSVKVLCLYESTPTGETKTYEEVVMLLYATNTQEARQRVIQHFEDEEPYENAAGGMTVVRLIDVVDVYEIIDPVVLPHNGTPLEVYSRYLIVDSGWDDQDVMTHFRFDV